MAYQVTTTLKGRKPEEVQPGRVKGVLFGGPGTGKTWLALSFPAPFYVDTEGGADLAHYQRRLAEAGGAYFGRDDGASDFAEIIGQVDALATERHSYKTLVIDSLSKSFGSMLAKEQERLGDKDAFGASKKRPVQMVRRLISHLERLDMNCWLICHEIDDWQSQDGGERKAIGRMPDCGWDKVPYELHLSLQIKKLGKGNREASVSKSRLTGFPEFDRFALQENGKDVAYENFLKRYGRDFIEAEPTPIVLVTGETAAEIRSLLEVVKVREDDLDKMLARARAETWEDLTQEQGDKVVAWLKAKVTSGGK